MHPASRPGKPRKMSKQMAAKLASKGLKEARLPAGRAVGPGSRAAGQGAVRSAGAKQVESYERALAVSFSTRSLASWPFAVPVEYKHSS